MLCTEQRKKQLARGSCSVGRRRRKRREITAGFRSISRSLMQVSFYEEKGKVDAISRGLDLGEVVCRGRESCLSRGSKGTALMVQLRSDQVKTMFPQSDLDTSIGWSNVLTFLISPPWSSLILSGQKTVVHGLATVSQASPLDLAGRGRDHGVTWVSYLGNCSPSLIFSRPFLKHDWVFLETWRNFSRSFQLFFLVWEKEIQWEWWSGWSDMERNWRERG